MTPGTEFGPYRIERLVARGGMGAVYLATDVRLERRVALKLLGEQWLGRPDFRDRFVRESRLAASLDHPHILPIFDAGEIDGQPFLAMRYVDGAPLDVLLRQSGPLDARRAVGIVTQVASALDAAHAAGLVHRDVKPGNVLVAPAADREHAYLSDFGVSRQIDNSPPVTQAGEVVGTVDYAAPEQISGQPLDHRVDVYSLACLLYELLTGVPPFRRDTPVASLFAHVHAERPSVLAVRPDVPQALDAVVSRGMAVDPALRFETAGELARAAAMALEDVTFLAASGGADALRSEANQSQQTGVIGVAARHMEDSAQPFVTATADTSDPGPVMAPQPVGTALPPPRPPRRAVTGRPTPARPSRNLVAAGLATVAAVLVLAIAGVAVMSNRPVAATTPGVGQSGGPGDSVTDGVAGTSCEVRELSAPASGRWRLWRTEFGQRGRGDYLRLKLRGEGDHEQTATATAQVIALDQVAQAYGLEPPTEGDVALVVSFNGPVTIGGGWGAAPRYSGLRSFRIARGREGNVYAVAGVTGSGCFSVSGGAWDSGAPANATDITLEIERP